MNSEIRDAGQEGTKEPALQFVRDLYEYFQGPHACGDFTCACGDVKSCGICEMRVRTEKFLAEVPVSAPVPERTNGICRDHDQLHAYDPLACVDWHPLAAPVPQTTKPEQEPDEVAEKPDDYIHCAACGQPFNDGGGLYCSARCEEIGNPGAD